MDFNLPILVWNRLWFSKEVREYINIFHRFDSKWEGKRHIYEFEMDFKKSFLVLFYISVSNNDLISWRQGLKSGREARSVSGRKNDIFWSEIGSGFRESKGTPLPKINRSTPPAI